MMCTMMCNMVHTSCALTCIKKCLRGAPVVQYDVHYGELDGHQLRIIMSSMAWLRCAICWALKNRLAVHWGVHHMGTIVCTGCALAMHYDMH